MNDIANPKINLAPSRVLGIDKCGAEPSPLNRLAIRPCFIYTLVCASVQRGGMHSMPHG